MNHPIAKTEPLDDTPEGWIGQLLRETDQNGRTIARWLVQGRDLPSAPWKTALTIARKGTDAKAIADQLSKEIDRAGLRFAQVLAFFGGAKHPRSVFPWPVEAGPEFDGWEALDGTQGGLVRQAQHHLEIVMGRLLRQSEMMLIYMSNQNEALRGQVDGALQDRIKFAEALSGVIVQRAEHESATTRNEAVAGGLKNVVDAIVFRLTGGVAAADSRERIMIEALKRFGDTITPEQKQALHKVLGPEQAIMLEAVTTDPEAVVSQTQQNIAKVQAKADARNKAQPQQGPVAAEVFGRSKPKKKD